MYVAIIVKSIWHLFREVLQGKKKNLLWIYFSVTFYYPAKNSIITDTLYIFAQTTGTLFIKLRAMSIQVYVLNELDNLKRELVKKRLKAVYLTFRSDRLLSNTNVRIEDLAAQGGLRSMSVLRCFLIGNSLEAGRIFCVKRGAWCIRTARSLNLWRDV